MQLFVDYSFFLWLAALSVPAFILGVMEKPLRHYGFAVSLLFLWFALGANHRALAFLVLFIAMEYGGAECYRRLRQSRGRVAWQYYLFLCLSILPLCLQKFGTEHLFAFLGISYMTFKSAQMIIQIYDGQIREVKLFEYIYMMIFFPVITSGPIDRSERFRRDAERVIPRGEYLELAGRGLFKILLGYLYKDAVAAGFYQLMRWFGMGLDLKGALIYMYSYGFYLFFDFAGYSLMAVGASYLFGIRTPDNFRAPFLSVDIKDFWDRWHITLSHWFRDFIFSRISMDIMKTRKIKSRLAIGCIAFMINMGIMGLWHGTAPYYIAYGLYHGLLLSLTEVYQKKSKFYKKHKKDRWFRLIEWAVTFQLVMFGFFLFSGRITAFLK